jgi:hypothetical protein
MRGVGTRGVRATFEGRRMNKTVALHYVSEISVNRCPWSAG